MTWSTTGSATGVVQINLKPVSFELNVWARGEIISQYFGPGTGSIMFQVDDVRLPDVLPEGLETVLHCLIRMMLQAPLSNLQLPFRVKGDRSLTRTKSKCGEIFKEELCRT